MPPLLISLPRDSGPISPFGQIPWLIACALRERRVPALKLPPQAEHQGCRGNPCDLLSGGPTDANLTHAIGNWTKAQLEHFGIRLLADEPGVGANLSDHPALSVVCQLKEGIELDHDDPLIQTILRYTTGGESARNNMQIELLSHVGRPDGPARIGIAACLEYQDGRGALF